MRVLVTGGSRGIGHAISNAFLSSGHSVAINGRNEARLRGSSFQNSKTYFIPGDITDEEVAKSVVERSVNELGGLDAIICNVGSGSSVEPGSENYAEWQRMFDKNFFSSTNIIEAGTKYLQESKGSVVCISSICGCEIVLQAPITYSVAKAALNAYVKGISRPLGELGIRINAVAPGNVLFQGSVWDRKIKENKQKVDKMLIDDVPLQRLGTSQEVADVVVWLVSPAARFITGTILVSDGGQTRSL